MDILKLKPKENLYIHFYRGKVLDINTSSLPMCDKCKIFKLGTNVTSSIIVKEIKLITNKEDK